MIWAGKDRAEGSSCLYRRSEFVPTTPRRERQSARLPSSSHSPCSGLAHGSDDVCHHHRQVCLNKKHHERRRPERKRKTEWVDCPHFSLCCVRRSAVSSAQPATAGVQHQSLSPTKDGQGSANRQRQGERGRGGGSPLVAHKKDERGTWNRCPTGGGLVGMMYDHCYLDWNKKKKEITV